MNKILTTCIFSLFTIGNVYAVSITDPGVEISYICEDTVSVNIEGGTLTTQTPTYAEDIGNCANIPIKSDGSFACMCYRTSNPIYTCKCNTGYTVQNQGTSTCSCKANVCPAGTYLNNGTCINCATATGHTSATSAQGSTAITDCYLPTGTTGGDTTGNYTYTDKCYYK